MTENKWAWRPDCEDYPCRGDCRWCKMNPDHDGDLNDPMEE